MYSLPLRTQGALVGVGVSIAAAHQSEIERTGQNLLRVRAGRLSEANKPHTGLDETPSQQSTRKKSLLNPNRHINTHLS